MEHVIITWLFYTNPLVNFNNSFWNKKVTLRVKGGRFEGGFWGKSGWRDVENIIFINYLLKRYSHIEPESLLQEFNTNTAAIRCLLTLTYLL